MFNMLKDAWPPGVPCEHPGCLSHVSHPCEGCGRTNGRYPPLRPLRRMLREWRKITLLLQAAALRQAMIPPVRFEIRENGELVEHRARNALEGGESAREYVAGIILHQNGGAEMIRNGVVDPEKLAKKLHALSAVARQSEITPTWVAMVLADASALVEKHSYTFAAEELEKIGQEVKVELPPSIQIGLHDLEDETLLLAVHGEEEVKKLLDVKEI